MADNKAADGGEFDYVIVGAGSAGCALAARLTEDPKTTVCLLEAGGRDDNPLIHTPVGFAFHPDNWKGNWRFDTVPQKHLNGRLGHQPRGRVLGGSSSINAMVYIRGTPNDYDAWERLGASGWSYKDVLPYFKKSEDNERGADEWHGKGGPVGVSDLRFKNPLSQSFLDAARELQLPSNDDFNGARQEGIGYYQVTQRNGRRCSAAKGYLEPAKARQNLNVVVDAHTERVTFDGMRATGVVYRCKGVVRQVSARREVVLAAGAFQSPQLLMLSGIGPPAHLQSMGVDVVAASHGVGENLQDHIDYVALRKTNSPHAVGLNVGTAAAFIPGFIKFKREGKGFLSSNLAEAGGFLKTDPALAEPDIQLHFLPALVDDHGRKKHLGGGYSCHVCVLRPKSRGTVRLASPDPMAHPAIDPNFLDHPDDLLALKRGAKMVYRIFDAPAFAAVNGDQLYLAKDAGDEALVEDIRSRADTVYHPVGTCRMGGADAVLDPQLRVRGVSNLRVADASVMPTLIGGNTNAPSIMIGEKAADLMRF